jgi:hypothetical protein
MSVVLTPICVLHHDPRGGASSESRTHVVEPQADAQRRHLLHASVPKEGQAPALCVNNDGSSFHR